MNEVSPGLFEQNHLLPEGTKPSQIAIRPNSPLKNYEKELAAGAILRILREQGGDAWHGVSSQSIKDEVGDDPFEQRLVATGLVNLVSEGLLAASKEGETIIFFFTPRLADLLCAKA